MIPETYEDHKSGFQFDNFVRNEKLIATGHALPKFQSTGTTIAAITFKDGVILAADTRATSGSIVADKESRKIHPLLPNMMACGAGTAADLDLVTKMMSGQLELHRLHTGREVPVVAANRLFKQYLFRYQGHVGCALIVGGVDKYGFHIYTIHPHGSSERLPFTTMGSGSLAALTVLETRWKPDLELEEGKKLLRDAIVAGIIHDNGSGSSVDLCVITKNGAQMHRFYEHVQTKGKRLGKYEYKKGTTEVLSMKTIPIEIIESTTTPVESMDTA